MAKIITKHSTTPASAPSGLTVGELAVNLADRDLYVGGTAGTTYLTGVKTYNGATGAVQGVSSANGFTGAVVFGACNGLSISYSGGAITYGIDSGYALMRSVGNTGELEAIPNPLEGDLVFVRDEGTYYYRSYYAPLTTYKWVKISIIGNSYYGDLNGDGNVNGADLGILLAHWGNYSNSSPLNFGVQDGLSGSFVIYAADSANPKKSDMVRVSTEGATSQFLVNTNTVVFRGQVEIDGEDSDSIALTVYNGKTDLNGDMSINGILQITNGGVSGGFIDGGSYT